MVCDEPCTAWVTVRTAKWDGAEGGSEHAVAAHHLVVLGASWVALEAVGTSRDVLVTFMLVVHEWGVVDGRWLWPSCRGVHP